MEHLIEVKDWWLREKADVRRLESFAETPLEPFERERPRLLLMLDGDEAGRAGARHLASRLEDRDITLVSLPEGADPADLPDPVLLDHVPPDFLP